MPATPEHALAVANAVTVGLHDLAKCEYAGADRALAMSGAIVSVDFCDGCYERCQASLPKGAADHFRNDDDSNDKTEEEEDAEDLDAWAHVTACIHDAIVNELPDVVYPTATVWMVYVGGRMCPLPL